jgi:hypothetical protein
MIITFAVDHQQQPCYDVAVDHEHRRQILLGLSIRLTDDVHAHRINYRESIVFETLNTPRIFSWHRRISIGFPRFPNRVLLWDVRQAMNMSLGKTKVAELKPKPFDLMKCTSTSVNI